MCKKYQPHDKIAIFNLSKRGISKKVAELYNSGFSLLAVSEELQVSRWKARTLLKEKRIPLRSQVADIETKGGRPLDRSPKVAPYGFCLLNGQVVMDPREQAVIQIIERYWRQGMNHRAIARALNGKKFKPRRAQTWSQTFVSSVIKRLSKSEKK